MSPGFAWAPEDWRHDIYDALKRVEVRQVAYVPDAGHASLIEACQADPEIEATVLTTEEEGVGVLAGADLGGQRGALLMQSSGVGNCINTFTLLENCGFPLLTLITMRGEWAEFNPWQVPMGRATPASLDLVDFLQYRVERPEEAGPVVEAAARTAFDCDRAAAVLLTQRLIGAKVF